MYNMCVLKEKNAYHYIWHPDKLLYFRVLLQERVGEKRTRRRGWEIKKKKKRERERYGDGERGKKEHREWTERVQKWKTAPMSVK